MQKDWCENNYLVTFLTTKPLFSVTHMGEILMDHRGKLELVLFPLFLPQMHRGVPGQLRMEKQNE